MLILALSLINCFLYKTLYFFRNYRFYGLKETNLYSDL